MDNSKMTKELLDKYYENMMNRNEWVSLLSDEFLLTGTVAKESRGKQSYIDNNFFKMVKRFKIKTMIVSGDNACALVSYDLVSPKGNSFSSDVAEIWKTRNGKLDSIGIFFDTAAFQKSVS